ncbi:sodium:proton antiporter [bacterium]|nr:sodium:proton antiporter [bacterium]MBU1959040.1 sodium:proton antiporter [bacterium]
MENLGLLSVLIPLFIIIMAIITKDVVVSLLSGIFLGELVIHQYNPFEALIALLDGFIGLFSEGWITKTVLFALLVGAIIKLISNSGGVDGFIHYISKKEKNIDSPKGSLLLAYVLGVIIFIESSITALIAGTVAKPLCDKNGVSREKLAFVCDSTSAPICSLIPFNAWGALLLGLIVTAVDAHVIEGQALSLLIQSIFFNFYSLIVVVMVLVVILFDVNIGSMRHAQAHKLEENTNIKTKHHKSPLLMILPLIVLIAMVPLSLYYTGKGEILEGSGSTSVFYAVIATLLFIYLYYVPSKHIKHKEYFNTLYAGISDMIPIVFILLLAFLIGNVIKELGTANYIADVMNSANISPIFIPLLVFLVAALTSFSTGTSWGTFSIMMPIALALGATFDISIPLVIGAVVSGGIFGDHVSPISDTTIISSMASGCDHISHVRTQMPYALIAAGLASILYLLMGWVML